MIADNSWRVLDCCCWFLVAPGGFLVKGAKSNAHGNRHPKSLHGARMATPSMCAMEVVSPTNHHICQAAVPRDVWPTATRAEIGFIWLHLAISAIAWHVMGTLLCAISTARARHSSNWRDTFGICLRHFLNFVVIFGPQLWVHLLPITVALLIGINSNASCTSVGLSHAEFPRGQRIQEDRLLFLPGPQFQCWRSTSLRFAVWPLVFGSIIARVL